MSESGDNHVADDGAKWSFDEKVTASFDAMLADSIPSYETMRNLCFELGKNFVHKGSLIVDLGASRGQSIQRFVDHFDSIYAPTAFDVTGLSSDGVQHVLFEISPPMMDVLKDKFSLAPNIMLCPNDITVRGNISAVCLSLIHI